MSQQLLTELQEKTKPQIAHRESRPDSAQTIQGGVPPISQLQRTIGNRRVAQLIQAKRLTPQGKILGVQAKLTVGAAGDQYEQEADRVAHQVLNTPDAVAANSMQRAMSLEEDKDQTLQTKPLATSITPVVQRQMRQEDEKDKSLQATSAGSLSDSFEAGADVETQLSLSKGRGSPLPDPVRSYMEPRFGMDFSHVRVHTGTDALQMNRAVGAQAFTHGTDIYFGAGHSPTNLDLTAHELTHVIQQGGDTVQAKPALGEPGDLYKQKADQVSQKVVGGQDGSVAAPGQLFSYAGAGAVQRKCSCGGQAASSGKCEACRHDPQAAIHPFSNAPAALELIPERPFSEKQAGSLRSKTDNSSFEVVMIKEAVMGRNGIRRRISLDNRPGAWIARKWNWRRSLCHAACWGLGGGLAALIASACAVGTVVTIGGAAIPCTALVVGGAVGAGALAALCSDACDQYIADNSDAQAGNDPNAPAVADASGQALTDTTVEDVTTGGQQEEEPVSV